MSFINALMEAVAALAETAKTEPADPEQEGLIRGADPEAESETESESASGSESETESESASGSESESESEAGLYASIVFGSDPPYNGICMIQGAGFPDEKHLDTGMLYRLPVLLNGKNESQELLLEDLTAIHAVLTKRNDFSELNTDEVQVVAIRTTSLPQIIGREQNNQWIAGSSLEISFYWR